LITGRSASARAWLQTPGGAARAGVCRNRRGFTLLELIVVLGLLGVLLGMAAPSLRGFMGSRQTADAAGQILALTQLAGSRAVAQGTLYRFNLDAKTNTYCLLMQEGGSFVGLNNEFGRSFQFPDGTSFKLTFPQGTPARSYIEFYPNGRTEEATIELRGRQGEVYQVLCESASERFHIVSPIGDTK
jgi:prepilin-type N-terminal cleavage/methylation domain-containing protein